MKLLRKYKGVLRRNKFIKNKENKKMKQLLRFSNHIERNKIDRNRIRLQKRSKNNIEPN